MKKIFALGAMIFLVAGFLTGCESKMGTGAGVGTVLGAGTGAIIGHQSGHRTEGAIVGAAAGGLGGALVGSEMDKKDMRREHEAELRQRDQGY